MMRCRWFVDEPAIGSWNMAVDETLLESAVASDDSLPALRWYQWSEPTLSLGYFQSTRDIPPELERLSRVRRLTGGGGIVHDREITYSLAIPGRHWPRVAFLDVVRDVHQALRQHLVLDWAGYPEEGAEVETEPFLCFERRATLDLVNPAGKVVGSAQRKHRGALLQHGSILLSSSRAAPHLSGLEADDGETMVESIIESVTRALCRQWGWTAVESVLSEEESARAEELAREKYTSPSWNDRR